MQHNTDYTAQINDMLATIKLHDYWAKQDCKQAQVNAEILALIGEIPRHEFVPDELRANAYADSPLPIGYGQTISQPYIVALMTSLLAVKPEHSVLEVGTGSGYQSAILAKLAKDVYTLEIIAELRNQAMATIKRLNISNIHFSGDNGYLGWQQRAPFDRIIITAAASELPANLVTQLKIGGKMVLPIDDAAYGSQILYLIDKIAEREIHKTTIIPVRFVPMLKPKDDG